MLYQKFIRLVEEHADDLIQNWMNEVRNNPSTPSYKNVPEATLKTRVYDVYQRLGHWLLDNDPNYTEVANHFVKLGYERAKEGIKGSEITYAVILARVVMWRFVTDQVMIQGALDLQQSLDFYHKVNNFFDKAIYFISVGVEKSMEKEEPQEVEEDFVEKSVGAIAKWLIRDPHLSSFQ